MENYSIFFVLTCVTTFYAVCYSMYRKLFFRAGDDGPNDWLTESNWHVQGGFTGVLFLISVSLGLYIYGQRSVKKSRKSKIAFVLGVVFALLAFLVVPTAVLFLLAIVPVLVIIYTHPISDFPSLCQLLFKVFTWLLIASIPWEYMRLYQHQIALQIMHTTQGIPSECQMSSSSTVWNAFTATIKDLFSWEAGSAKCLEYHKAILIDPLWEVTPALAFVSLMTRCVLYPLAVGADSIGLSFRKLFQHIPLQWQPVLYIPVVCSVMLLAIMACGYKINIMHVFSVEKPKFISHQVSNGGDCGRAVVERSANKTIYTN